MSSPMSGPDTLDRILRRCIRHNICVLEGRDMLQHGRFRFSVYPHDTGCSVIVWVVNDEGECYEIIQGTFWYDSRYCHNTFKWEKGAWDAALTETTDHLKRMADAADAEALRREKAEADARKERNDAVRAKFEGLFSL